MSYKREKAEYQGAGEILALIQQHDEGLSRTQVIKQLGGERDTASALLRELEAEGAIWSERIKPGNILV